MKSYPTTVHLPHTWEFEVTKDEWFTVEADLIFDVDPGEPPSRDCPGCDAHATLCDVTIRHIEGQTTDKPATKLTPSVMPQLFCWIAEQLKDTADEEDMNDLCMDRIAEDYER